MISAQVEFFNKLKDVVQSSLKKEITNNVIAQKHQSNFTKE